MNIQPKPYLDNFRLRKKAFGNERRRNMLKLITDKSMNFPKPIEFEDIDNAVNDWINSLEIAFEGKKLPIFKLFSTQRIGEYAQTWKHLDEVGNLLMNFFTITRENNPKQGQNQGSYFNIPGNRSYPLYIKPTLQENGEEAYDMYSMKQPFSVDFVYTITLITNKYELLNEVNQKILNEFKALECYIAPNNHYMPMKLEDIDDESEYTVDDRKYYSQTYKITLWGYIIREEDFEVTKLPSRLVGRMLGLETKPKKKTTTVSIEEIEDYDEPLQCCNEREKEKSPYTNKIIKLNINFPMCEFKTEFEIDTTFTVTDIHTENVYDFVMKINNQYVNFDDEVNIEDGDMLYFEMERNNKIKDASIILFGDSDEIISVDDKESILDEEIGEEELIKNV